MMQKIKKVIKGKLPAFLKQPLKLKRKQWNQAKRDYKRWRKTGFVTLVNRYNVYDKYGICYIDVPKVASTSIKKLMLDLYGIWDSSAKDTPLAIRKYTHRLTNKHFMVASMEGISGDYFTFSFVRNPFARLVSTYQNLYLSQNLDDNQIYDVYAFGYLSRKKGLDKDFKRFAYRVLRIPDAFAERHFISQYAILYDRQGKPRAQFVGKIEQLKEDWQVIQSRTGLPDLPHHNSTKNHEVSWMDFYDLKLAQKVYNRYRQDIEIFGYEETYHQLIDYLRSKES